MKTQEIFHKMSRALIERNHFNFLTHCHELDNGCIEWTGARGPKGYGKFHIRVGTGDDKRVNTHAHIWAYAYSGRLVSEGLQLDHRCNNEWCVNVEHLRPVTPRENTRRSPFTIASKYGDRTHCENGHALTPDNIFLRPEGGRRCLTCFPNVGKKGRYLACPICSTIFVDGSGRREYCSKRCVKKAYRERL